MLYLALCPSVKSRVSSSWFHQSLSVPFDFPVWFGRGLFSGSSPVWAELWQRLPRSGSEQVFLAVESSVLHHHPNVLHAFLAEAARAGFPKPSPPLVFPGGETCKNGLPFVEQTLHWLADAGACRQSILVAVGGGAFLDTVGLAAALWHRGIRLVRVPTTLLAQADSGVGVKNAINWAGHKNGLGTFAAPAAVLNDIDFLDTLPTPVLREGMAEAFKVALIRDAAFFHWLCHQAPQLAAAETSAVAELVHRSARLHLDHIRAGGDPFETGQARPLDYGHWLAHELERRSGYTLSHGQAVAIGVAVDTSYAVASGWLDPSHLDLLLQAWKILELPVTHPLLDEHPETLIRSALDRFREHLGGRLSLTFPDGLGRSRQVESIHDERMRAALQVAKGMP